MIEIDANIIHYKEASLHGAFSAAPGDCRLSMDLLGKGSFHASSLITHELPLSKAREGMDLMKNGESLKVILGMVALKRPKKTRYIIRSVLPISIVGTIATILIIIKN